MRNRKMAVRAALVFVIMCIGLTAYGVDHTLRYHLYFENDESRIDSSYLNNSATLAEMSTMLEALRRDTAVVIRSVEIDSYTSPVGGVSYNDKLSARRTEALAAYLTQELAVPSTFIVSRSSGIAWRQLSDWIAATEFPNKERVLEAFTQGGVETWRRINPSDRYPTLVDSRNKRLMDVAGGRAYRYMAQHIFPQMRVGCAVVIHYADRHPLAVAQPSMSGMLPAAPQLGLIPIPAPEQGEAPLLFAVKSNLLADLATALNIEVEVPIGKRISITGEYTFPFWRGERADFTMRTMMGHVGVNYWLGDRDKWAPLTGWHIGVVGGYAGKYDYQLFSDKGVQGDYKMAGLNVGFAHRIAKNLHLEYKVGAGWTETIYRNYTMAYGTKYGDIKVFDYPWLTKRNRGLGLTQLKVSLVYTIKGKKH